MLSRDTFKDRLSKIKEYFDFIDKLYDMGIRIEGQYSYKYKYRIFRRFNGR